MIRTQLTKRTLFFLVLTALLSAIAGVPVSAQVLRQMEVANVPQGESILSIVLNPDVARLIVHSPIENLEFETNHGILRFDNPNAGEYIIHLEPGTHIIWFKAEGYMTVKKKFYIPIKQYKEVRVTPLSELIGDKAELGTVEFKLSPGAVTVVKDGKRIGQIMVSTSGILSMSLPPGEHIVKLIRAGEGLYEVTFSVDKGKTIRREVAFVGGGTGDVEAAVRGGILVIESDPPDVLVFIDGAEVGRTPFQSKDIEAGNHLIRLEKPFYSYSPKQIDIRPDKITNLNEKLKPNFGVITVNSNPPGTDISIDGKYVGQAPHKFDMLTAGLHSIVLSAKLYHDATWELELKPGDVIDTTISLSPAFGKLVVSSLPHGASVYLENSLIGETPLTKDSLSSGEYALRIENALYVTLEKTITIQDGHQTTISTPLDQNFGTLTVTSDPPGIKVRLEGVSDSIGVTPCTKLLSPGFYTVVIENAAYVTHTENATIVIGDTIDISTSLERGTGTVRIFTDPLYGDIYIDDDHIGKAPQIKDLPTGTYSIEAKKMGYHSQVRDIRVILNKTVEVDFQLDLGCSPNMGIFDFSELQDSVRVYHNGSLLGQTPFSYKQVEAGAHVFEFKRKHCESSGKQRLTLKDQQTIRLTYQPIPKTRGKAAIRSLFFPGWGQYYSEKKTKGTLFLITELASLGWVGYSYANYKSKEKDYQAALDDYVTVPTLQQEEAAWQKVNGKFDSFSSARDQLATSFLIPVALHAINFFDALIFGGAPDGTAGNDRKQFGIEYKPQDNNGVGVSIYAMF